MNDMDAFERQLANVMQQGGRPSLPVDAAAMVRSAVTAAPSGRWSVITRRLRGGVAPTPTEGGFTMFSIAKYVAAGVIVALFGGFLLSSALTTPQGEEAMPAALTASPSAEAETEATRPDAPSPVSADETLAGFVAEQVEPGVIRVANDGVSDLEWPLDAGCFLGICIPNHLMIGLDGSVWVIQADGLQQLGEEGVIPFPVATTQWNAWPKPRIRVGADGTPWMASQREVSADEPGRLASSLLSWDGSDWQVRLTADDSVWEGIDFRLQPGGTVWAQTSTDKRGRYRYQRLEGDDWTRIPRPPIPTATCGPGPSRTTARSGPCAAAR
jgi:hypothetical protein